MSTTDDLNMTPDQIAALKKLQAALLGCQRAGLAIVGIDNILVAAVVDEELKGEIRCSSATEAILRRLNEQHPLAATIKHHGCYRDSGGA